MIKFWTVSAMGACIGAVWSLSHYTSSRFCNHTTIFWCFCCVSNIVVSKFPKGKIDDALDVFACHGVGGMIGMLLTGVFASKAVNQL
jgi:Amt family ammonium transporter